MLKSSGRVQSHPYSMLKQHTPFNNACFSHLRQRQVFKSMPPGLANQRPGPHSFKSGLAQAHSPPSSCLVSSMRRGLLIVCRKTMMLSASIWTGILSAGGRRSALTHALLVLLPATRDYLASLHTWTNTSSLAYYTMTNHDIKYLGLESTECTFRGSQILCILI